MIVTSGVQVFFLVAKTGIIVYKYFDHSQRPIVFKLVNLKFIPVPLTIKRALLVIVMIVFVQLVASGLEHQNLCW